MRVPFLSILLFIIGLCTSANGNADVVSDNRLYIEDIVLVPGETKEVPLYLSNANVVKAVQGNIKLPDGFTFATKSNGRLDVKNVDERSEDFTLSCALQEDGSMTFAHYSGDGFAYEGSEGGVFTFKITADDSVQPGNYDIVLSDVVLSINGVGYEMPDRVSKITIEGEPPTIVTATALSYQRQYGAANPTFEYTTEGGELTGTPEITCEATATSPVGTYPIVITQGTVTNENESFVNGTLTITKAPLTITANNYTIEQGDALPSFEMTYDGFVNGETQDVLTTPPTITCTATDSNTPGTFDIVVSGADAQNYNITYGKGKLTIVPSDNIDPIDPIDPTGLHLIFTDGSDEWFLFEQKPVVTFSISELTITTSDDSYVYTFEEVAEFRFGTPYVDRVSDEPVQTPRLVQQGNDFLVDGIGIEAVGIYDLSGRKLPSNVQRLGEGISVSLQSLPRGTYIIRLNNKSIKVLKK